MKTLLTAAWVAPMNGPIVRDGGVVHEGGRIVAVGFAKSLERAHPDAIVEELGDIVLLPGLVNAHAHLDLTWARRPPAPISFTAWVLNLIEQMKRDDRINPDGGDRRTGLADCLAFGVTSVGDITAHPRGERGLMASTHRRPRLVSYGEVRAMAMRRGRLAEHLFAATEHGLSPTMRIGVSPHAPYSVEPDGFRECLAIARRLRLPLATHLAETPDEAEFLSSHRGPLRDLWDAIGGWDDAVPTFTGGPIRYAKHLGLLHYDRTSLAHVNYCNDDELALLATGQASVAYCPRTHCYFGHPPHRWRDMLAEGINVAVGTDSSASSPDLNLVDDLRLLRDIAPDVPAETIWSMATSRAAQAVSMQKDVGTISAGKCADFVAFAATGDQPLGTILDDPAQRPLGVWIAGERVV